MADMSEADSPIPEKWNTYEKFRADMIARQRDAEREGFEPTKELLGMEPWPPDWEALRIKHLALAFEKLLDTVTDFLIESDHPDNCQCKLNVAVEEAAGVLAKVDY